MVDISHETKEATHLRLLSVIQDASLYVYEETFRFDEFPSEAFPTAIDPCALALVRDGALWSQLVPKRNEEGEAFAIFSFHFPPDRDNSGFVGWLASRLKERLGTGVFVICGHNADRGGIFDYWGCPAALANEVLAELNAMIAGQDATPDTNHALRSHPLS